MDDDTFGALLLLGSGFRLLACIDWAIMYLPFTHPEKGVTTLRVYNPPLQAWVAALRDAA